jgi:hypothetical protein
VPTPRGAGFLCKTRHRPLDATRLANITPIRFALRRKSTWQKLPAPRVARAFSWPPSAQATESKPNHPTSRLAIDANRDHGAIAAEVAMGQQAMTGQLAGKRILIVEGEPMIAENLAYQMTIEGAEVIGPVATAEAALDAISDTARLRGFLMIIMQQPAHPFATLQQARLVAYAHHEETAGCCPCPDDYAPHSNAQHIHSVPAAGVAHR